MVINSNGNISVGFNDPPIIPANILHVGDGGRLNISNDTTDYTSIGSKETNDANNTRITINGYQRAGGNAGILNMYQHHQLDHIFMSY
jgi:hypothetical protein